MKERYTTVTLGSFSRDDAERLSDTLRASMSQSFLQPCEIGAGAGGGQFSVFLTTRYVFTDEDGADVEDNEKALLDHMVFVLACELLK